MAAAYCHQLPPVGKSRKSEISLLAESAQTIDRSGKPATVQTQLKCFCPGISSKESAYAERNASLFCLPEKKRSLSTRMKGDSDNDAQRIAGKNTSRVRTLFQDQVPPLVPALSAAKSKTSAFLAVLCPHNHVRCVTIPLLRACAAPERSTCRLGQFEEFSSLIVIHCRANIGLNFMVKSRSF